MSLSCYNLLMENHHLLKQLFSKKPPKINPGGLRNPLACEVGARRVPTSLPEASGALFICFSASPSDYFKCSPNLRPKEGVSDQPSAAHSPLDPPYSSENLDFTRVLILRTRFPLPASALGRKARTSAGQVSAFGLQALQRSYA